MNLLAHLLLADRTATSYAGQILGDEIKGRLDGRFDPAIEHGIRLHRAIDSHSDAHSAHRALRNRFAPPLRRYAPILVDIGLDHALARSWSTRHADESLGAFADRVQAAVVAEWPNDAPFCAERLSGLSGVLCGYARTAGIERALASVSHRLRRDNPVGEALPELIALDAAFDAALPEVLGDLERMLYERC